MSSLIGNSAVVTGGCSGIGCEVVKKFLGQGIKNVAILDICDTKNISQSLQSTYGDRKVVFIETDVSKKDQVKRAFDKIIKIFDYIDIVVGNAGILCETDYERMINVNLLGVLHSTYTAIEFMSEEKCGHGGTVINVASIAALEVYSNMPVYSASKHGIIGWQRCFSVSAKILFKFIVVALTFSNAPITYYAFFSFYEYFLELFPFTLKVH